ncbi:MAG: glucose-6-phosphate dehydrogenase assembly protein OpcA, partial [Vulcanimicrobiaceae bacterium]
MTAHIDSFADISSLLERLRDVHRGSYAPREATASAITMNFVVFTDDRIHREWVHERALTLAGKHPSRLIVLDASGNHPGADLFTSAGQTESGSVPQERIELAVGDVNGPVVRSLVQGLCVSNAPTVLWWAGKRLAGDARFEELVGLAQTVIVDSSGIASDARCVRELSRVHRHDARLRIFDLAYLRLAPWQEMIAQFFDEPALSAELPKLERLEIDSGSDAEATYLAAWLAARLGWVVKPDASFTSSAGRTVRFLKHELGDQRRMLRIALATACSTYTAAISADDPFVVALSVSGRCERPTWLVPLRRVDTVSLLERAILASGNDPCFGATLEMAEQLA